MGNKPVTNVQHKIWARGEKLMDQIEFEEWSLKGLDSDFGPHLWSKSREGLPQASTSTAEGSTGSAASVKRDETDVVSRFAVDDT